MPLRIAGTWRKRWRYLGAYADEVLLCAARVQVGLFAQTFWAVWDRDERHLYERTVTRRPWSSGEVWTEDAEGERVELAPQEGSRVRIEARHPKAGSVHGFLRAGEGTWAESVCPNGAGGFVWTRKRADVPVEVDVHIGDRRIRTFAKGIEDESAGYHPRHTVWSWSAGVGELVDGRSVGWNLVEGVNDPPERSERAIWLDGVPSEPGAVSFDALDAITSDDGSRLEFHAESERRAEENRVLVRYSYRQPFGTFRGTLPGGLELRKGLGVMEHHDAVW
jgi:hypothetical protein